MFSITKIGRFLRRFSVVDFSAVDFLDFLKTVKIHTKNSCVCMIFFKSNAFLWFDFQLMVLLFKEEMRRINTHF